MIIPRLSFAGVAHLICIVIKKIHAGACCGNYESVVLRRGCSNCLSTWHRARFVEPSMDPMHRSPVPAHEIVSHRWEGTNETAAFRYISGFRSIVSTRDKNPPEEVAGDRCTCGASDATRTIRCVSQCVWKRRKVGPSSLPLPFSLSLSLSLSLSFFR
jgi:hypothetical protein